MSKPILSFNDSRLDKLRSTHAMLCRTLSGSLIIQPIGTIPIGAKFIKAVKIAVPGKTFSEAMIIARKQIKDHAERKGK